MFGLDKVNVCAVSGRLYRYGVDTPEPARSALVIAPGAAACRRRPGGGQPAPVAERLEPRTLLAFGPAGPEFLVTEAAGRAPAVAMDAAGDYLVAWSIPNKAGCDVYAQQFSAAGNPLDGPLSVSAAADDPSPHVAVAMDGVGDFVVVWQAAAGVLARRYAAAGSAFSDPFQITSDGLWPDVATDALGNFVVTWQRGNGEKSPDIDVYARRYDPLGQPRAPEWRVNTTSGRHTEPDVASGGTGGFVIAWSSWEQTEPGVVRTSIHANRYDDSGEQLADVSLPSPGRSPSIAMDADGDFVLAWLEGLQGHCVEVRVERFDRHGQHFGQSFQPCSHAGSVEPACGGGVLNTLVTMSANGDFVVSWWNGGFMDSAGPGGAQRYAANGTPLGRPFTFTVRAEGPAIAMSPAGELVAIWEDYRTTPPEPPRLSGRRYGETPAPRVTQVFVGSSDWRTSFTTALQRAGIGESPYGYELIPSPYHFEDRFADEVLPWVNVNRISVRFSGPVEVADRHLFIAGIKVPVYAVRDVAYDASTFTATWTLSGPLRDDRIAFQVDGGPGGVTGTNGLRLDGEWDDTYPFTSGDGLPGGDFHLRAFVLPGDVDASGAVVARDCSDVKRRFFSTPAGGDDFYSLWHDVNGSGSILADDFAEVKRRFFTALPPKASAAPASARSWAYSPRNSVISQMLFASARRKGDIHMF
jgi:hypothetical protein